MNLLAIITPIYFDTIQKGPGLHDLFACNGYFTYFSPYPILLNEGVGDFRAEFEAVAVGLSQQGLTRTWSNFAE